MSDGDPIIAFIALSGASGAEPVALAGRAVQVSAQHYALALGSSRLRPQSSMGVLSTRIPPSDCRGGRGAGGGMDGDGERGGRE